MTDKATNEQFDRADWYDKGINWDARLAREIPRLTEVLGPPGDGGILDAGCGPGHQAIALAGRGYRVTALDLSAAMLKLAEQHARAAGAEVKFIEAPFAAITSETPGGFDGVFCQGNALAAAGSRDACRDAFAAMAGALRVGGRLLVQVLNFAKLRSQAPYVRGPRVTVRDGVEYISARHFGFAGDTCTVTNITQWKQDTWQMTFRSGTLYPLVENEVREWCAACGLELETLLGDYAGAPFAVEQSDDFIVVATRRG